MMIAEIMVFFYFLFWVFITVTIIYFIVKRIKTKKKEDFEKRDN